ncbi:DUF4870 family protein [Sulfuriferula sp. GW1]|uniref:DUF4870 family protein n=1 Tax=Sulfuriferula sp. GW1 TaxID=3345111 RepID=UPI0039AE99F0
MAENMIESGNAPADGLVTITHVIYGLHAFTVITGLLSPMLIVTAFLTGWPSILAVVLNYIKRSEARGTYLESHFRWQIRTFWFALLWVVVAGLLMLTLIGIPLAIAVVSIAGLWVLYRVARGWLRLNDKLAMPV